VSQDPASIPSAPAAPFASATSTNAPGVGDTDALRSPSTEPPLTILAACCSAVRYRILREFLDGSIISTIDVAARLGLTQRSIAKQLAVLREAGILVAVSAPDGDRRKQCYQLPAAFRTRDANGAPVLDFGRVVLRMG